LASAQALKEAIENGTAPPLLTLFTTWAERDDLRLVRQITFRNWGQLAPYIRPVLFTNVTSLAQEAVEHGWLTLPVSKEAVGVPILKFMYMDAIQR
jgi:hypothetical protein